MRVTADEIVALVRVQLGAGKVGIEDRLIEDLGAESLDLVNILAAVEDRFGVILDESHLQEIRTVADLHERVSSSFGR